MPRPVSFLLFSPFLLLLGCSGSDQEIEAQGAQKSSEEEIPLVAVERVSWRMVRHEIETTGTLESEHRVKVLSKLAGRVDRVPVDDGKRVKKGETLAVLDAREAKSAVRQAEVLLAERRVRLELAKLDIDVRERKVEQARIERERTKAEYDRNLDLAKDKAVSKKQLTESQFAYEAAREAHRVAEFDHRKSHLDVKATEQQIQELEAKLDDARIREQDHTIKSPLNGVVAKRMIRGGETISAATELFDVLDDNNLVAYIKRPQSELPLVRNARTVIFTTDAWPDREFTCDVDLVSPVIDAATGSFDMRIRVRKDDAKDLVAGMFLRARILTEDERRAVMIPKTAILADGETQIVFVVRGSKAVRITIEPGLETNTHLECRNLGPNGLRENDQIITSGQTNLRDQDPVEVPPQQDGAAKKAQPEKAQPKKAKADR